MGRIRGNAGQPLPRHAGAIDPLSGETRARGLGYALEVLPLSPGTAAPPLPETLLVVDSSHLPFQWHSFGASLVSGPVSVDSMTAAPPSLWTLNCEVPPPSLPSSSIGSKTRLVARINSFVASTAIGLDASWPPSTLP